MDTEHFKELLNRRDLKATIHRLKLLSTLQEYGSAMPNSEIQKSMQSTDRVTLYRTLEVLMDQGIIHKALTEDNESYYAICGQQCSKDQHHHEHIHFKCNSCNTVTCQELRTKVKVLIPGHEIQHVSIHVKGVCKDCK